VVILTKLNHARYNKVKIDSMGWTMYKQVMLLGLLLDRPMYGQQIREVIETHHDLFANQIKKPTIYYQLERLAADGYLEIRRETVEAPGPGAAHEDLALRERDVYYITDAGRSHFASLLRSMMSSYTPALSDVDACLYFLHHLSPGEACELLADRLQEVEKYRASVAFSSSEQAEAHRFVNEHKRMLLDAEIDWLKRTITQLGNMAQQSPGHLPHSARSL
jgi:DNA-binding PadR family transcriptional regulator